MTRRRTRSWALTFILVALLSAALLLVVDAARPLAAGAAATEAKATTTKATPPPATSATPPTTPSSTPFNPTQPGPCTSVQSQTELHLDPTASRCKGKGCTLTVSLTAAVPSAATDPQERCSRPLPVVLVLPGFSARNSMYQDYADLLASWGYAAVMYEAPLLGSFPPLNDSYEGSAAFVSMVAQAARRAAANNSATTTPVLLNESSLAQPMAIGHSRGGKIAALQMASKAVVTAALLDPVDGGLAPFFPPNPSAVAALRSSPPAAGALVVQAGIQGLCNSAIVGGDSLFWNALVAGGGSAGPSWRTILPKAGHGSLARLGPLFQPVAGLMCGGKVKKGGLPEDDAIRLAKVVSIEWIEKHWSGKVGASFPAPADFCRRFLSEESGVGRRMTAVEGVDGKPVCSPPEVAKVAAKAAEV
jgi:hypothetical protein